MDIKLILDIFAFVGLLWVVSEGFKIFKILLNDLLGIPRPLNLYQLRLEMLETAHAKEIKYYQTHKDLIEQQNYDLEKEVQSMRSEQEVVLSKLLSVVQT